MARAALAARAELEEMALTLITEMAPPVGTVGGVVVAVQEALAVQEPLAGWGESVGLEVEAGASTTVERLT